MDIGCGKGGGGIRKINPEIQAIFPQSHLTGRICKGPSEDEEIVNTHTPTAPINPDQAREAWSFMMAWGKLF
jgi:hypothetical protein